MPQSYVFDAYGTLFDVHAAARRHAEAIGPEFDRLSGLWRQRQLEYTWIYSMAGRQKSFWELTVASLDFAAAAIGGLSAEVKRKLLDAYGSLDAFPEVKPALAALKQKKCRTAILSNGDLEMLQSALKSADLAALVDVVMSAQDVGVFKPSGRVYRLAPTKLGVAKEAITFVSSNRWDVAGAQGFGFKTVWVNRAGVPDEYADLPAGRVVTDLSALAREDKP